MTSPIRPKPQTRSAAMTWLHARGVIPLTFTALAIAFASCGGSDEAAPSTTPADPDAVVEVSETARTEARELFASLCSTCHGLQGLGDGAAAAGYKPKPRSFADQTWQASVTDEHIKTVITLGGASVGKSPLMVPNPQLKSKPQVLQALVEIVRAFGK